MEGRKEEGVEEKAVGGERDAKMRKYTNGIQGKRKRQRAEKRKEGFQRE